MKLFIDRHCLSDIYSSSAKIFISEVDKQTFIDFFRFEQLASRITIYVFKCDRDRTQFTISPLRLRSLKPNLVTLNLVPNFCLGFLSFSKAGKNNIERLLNWWSNKGSSQAIPPVIELDPQQERLALQAEFWQRIYDLMTQQTQTLAQRIANLQKEFLNLRTLHEDMQNAFSTVEDYLSQAKLPPIQLSYDAQITDVLINPTELSDSNLVVKQLLPVASRGLAVIEIHIAKKYSKAIGYLKIDLKICEDITSMAVWQIPYSHLSIGWLSLDLPSIDLGRKRDIELIVEWHTQIGPAPALSLTKLQPIPEARVYTDNLNFDRSLAIRTWQGLPGTRKVTSPYLVLTKSTQAPCFKSGVSLTGNHQESAVPQLGFLGQGAMASAIEVTPNLPSEAFEHIQIFGNGAKILTHPRADGTATIAMLPYCFPPTANRLTASIATEHSQAGIIKYAMAIIEPEIDPQTCLDSKTALAFSEWIAVEPNTPREITLDLDLPVVRHCHIVIATKLASGSPTDFAWSHWLNFHLAIAEKNPAEEIDRQPIIDREKSQLRNASLNLAKCNFEKVQPIVDDRKIQVHPSREEDTVAILTNAVEPGITKVICTVCTENDSASIIEYAIAVIATDDDTAARLAVTSPNSALGFSGWQQVKANERYKLELDLVVPTVNSCHLVLATRLPENSSQSNAWARWLNIEYVASCSENTKVLVENHAPR